MKQRVHSSAKEQAERPIALTRVALALSSLFAVWLDPPQPPQFANVTYALNTAYVAYAMLVAAYVAERKSGDRLPLVTHVADIIVFSLFQYWTLGSSSPFFVYFIFSLFCAAMRWGWHATLRTAAVVITAYLVIGLSISSGLRRSEFELNRFIIRTVYLGMAAGLLVYLGRYEARLRDELERLARWPSSTSIEPKEVAAQVIEYAAHLVGSKRAVVVWKVDDEPSMYLAAWVSGGLTLTSHAPADLEPQLRAGLERDGFVWTATTDQPHPPIHPRLVQYVGMGPFSSAPFGTERVAGRIFFSQLVGPTAELKPLTEVVAREIASALDRLHATRRLRDLAASEERIRLARDLHDGVLQSLTGIRLELQSAARAVDGRAADVRDRFLAIERALAGEQRELRLFIAGLKPSPAFKDEASLASRLESMRQRLVLEWKVPVTIRIEGTPPPLPEVLDRSLPLVIHEGIVNALKHARPSRVTVTVDGQPTALRIAIADDGHGFAFRGSYDHEALTRANAGPNSLLERVTSLGGRLAVESSEAGSIVRIMLSV